MLNKIVLCSMVVGMAASLAHGAYKTISNDGDPSDWSDIPHISDPIGDNTSELDISRVSIANDSDNLYFLIEFDNSKSQYFGKSTRIQYVTVFLDTDGDLNTGDPVGLAGEKIGADYSLRANRRNSSNTSYEGALYEGDWASGGTSMTSGGNHDGLPKVNDKADVYAFETMVPLSNIGLAAGEQIGFTVWVTRSGDKDSQNNPVYLDLDWLDGLQNYTVAAAPEPASLMLLGLGGLLMLRRRSV